MKRSSLVYTFLFCLTVSVAEARNFRDIEKASVASLEQTSRLLKSDFAARVQPWIQKYPQLSGAIKKFNSTTKTPLSADVITNMDRVLSSGVPDVVKYVFHSHHDVPSGADQVGYQFTENGILSTSLDPKAAKRFAKGRGCVQDAIILFNTKNAAFLGSQHEILVGRGSRFEVLFIEPGHTAAKCLQRVLLRI